MSRSLEITLLEQLGGGGQRRQDHAELARRQRRRPASRRPSRRSSSASRRGRLGHLGPRRAHRRADPLDRLGADRLEHDLALLAAAGRLHLQRDDAEQALDRARHRVEPLDAAERDRRRLRADDPALAVHAALVDARSSCCASACSPSSVAMATPITR